MAYVLEATAQNGEFVYYTGRAGQGWVSSEVRESFPMSAELAERRVREFNSRTCLHGLVFEVLAR
jgi:thiamine monophosphate kinase